MNERLGPYTRCPWCGEKVVTDMRVTAGAETATDPGWHEPDVGSRALCAECGNLNVWQRSFIGLAMRRASPAEIADAQHDERIVGMWRALATLGRPTPGWVTRPKETP